MNDGSKPPLSSNDEDLDSKSSAPPDFVARYRGDPEANKPPRLERTEHGILQSADLRDRCPFPHELLGRRFGFTGIPLTAEEETRCRESRIHLPNEITERATVVCQPSVIPLSTPLAYPATVQHAEIRARGYPIHLEWISQTLGGPGGVNDEVRIYVGTALIGRSICLGRLGGNVNTLPATANIDEDFAIAVEWVHRDGHELVIELRARRSLGVKDTRLLPRACDSDFQSSGGLE
jgi:hypothetical protein